MAYVVSVLMLIVLPLQRLGAISGTCTQGSDGAFMTGVLLSSPLLFLISIWIAWTVYRASSTTISREQIRNIIGLSIVALSSIWLAWANASIWTEVFWGSGSPCGPDHAASAPGAAANATLVAMVYGAWPLLIAIKSALVLIVVVGARSKAGE